MTTPTDHLLTVINEAQRLVEAAVTVKWQPPYGFSTERHAEADAQVAAIVGCTELAPTPS